MGTASDNFGRAVARIAVAHILSSVGFDASSSCPLDALADIALRYISLLGKTASSCANLAGRAHANAFDVIAALEDLGSFQGFLGNGLPSPCLCTSGVLKDLAFYVNSEEDLPFQRPLPTFPVRRRRGEHFPSFAESGRPAVLAHVPEWLPVFPEPHTYIQSEASGTSDGVSKEHKIGAIVEQAQQQQSAKDSLLSLHRLLRIGGSDWPDAGERPDVQTIGGAKGTEAAVGMNPFLALPLPYGQVEIAEVGPSKDVVASKKFSILEAFAPLITAAESGTLEVPSSMRNMLSRERPLVHLSLGIDRETVAAALHSKAHEKRDTWLIKGSEKDDRKQRVEMILREAMENPQELPHL